jgi:hypothetical protein
MIGRAADLSGGDAVERNDSVRPPLGSRGEAPDQLALF